MSRILDLTALTSSDVCFVGLERGRDGDSTFFFAEMEENKTSLKQPNPKPNHLRNEKNVYLLEVSFIGNFNKRFSRYSAEGS